MNAKKMFRVVVSALALAVVTAVSSYLGGKLGAVLAEWIIAA